MGKVEHVSGDHAHDAMIKSGLMGFLCLMKRCLNMFISLGLCHPDMATWVLVNISSDYGLLPDGTNPYSDPVFFVCQLDSYKTISVKFY